MAMREITHGLAFPEGPVCLADGSVLVVEIRRGCVTRVGPDGAQTLVARTGGGPNGAALGPDGKVYVCNNGGFEWHDAGPLVVPGDQPADYTGGSIQRVDLATGSVETVYSACDGRPLRGPNDLVFDAQGGFWFSDHGKTRPRDRDRTGVFYALPDGSSIREVAFPLDAPNGIGLSPDGRRLYVAETHTGRVFWWEVTGPGSVRANPFAAHGGHLLVGLPGMQLLDRWRSTPTATCVATPVNGGITIISPMARGRSTPARPAHQPAFGGPDLATAYITLSGTGRLVALPWATRGLRLAFSER
jgi:gluconolactonase